MRNKSLLDDILLIKRHLFALKPDTDPGQGLLFLLNEFRFKKQLPTDLLNDIQRIWNARNAFVSSPSAHETALDEVADVIRSAKERLHL